MAKLVREDFMEDWPEEDVLEYRRGEALVKEMSDEQLLALKIDDEDRPPLMVCEREMKLRGLLHG